ncbi:MAG TPA: hypothetical protein VF727_02455 [Allosphingosinicella sp.]|jgi:hypothetical protein
MIDMKSGLKAASFAAAALAGAVPTGASAQLFFTPPDFKGGPVEANDPLIGLPIPGATQAEYRAHMLWNLRAGLNVAALQCQFSPFLRVVPNYNGILAHHSAELASAYTTLNGYFKRLQGPAKGQKAFDDYSTITYNNFSSPQMGFCQAASAIAKEALAAPKGELHQVARRRMRELRNSLAPVADPLPPYNPALIRVEAFPALPPLSEECWSKKNQLKEKCLTAR